MHVGGGGGCLKEKERLGKIFAKKTPRVLGAVVFDRSSDAYISRPATFRNVLIFALSIRSRLSSKYESGLREGKRNKKSHFNTK